jgi:hypothetical protein
MIVKSKIFQGIFLGIYVGGLYFSAGRQSYTDIIPWATITGFLFFINISSMMSQLAPVTLVFPTERSIFLKE